MGSRAADTAGAQALSFRRDVNGLRALAVASVVAFHVDRAAVPGGFVGVDIFFVISGYLISRILFAELRDGAFSLRDFYAKRVRRIFPALIVVMTVVWGAGWILLDPPAFAELGRQQREAAFFSLNFHEIAASGYFDLAAEARPLLHLWSLSIEKQFYIVWPALLILLFRWPRLVAPTILLIFAGSLAVDLVLTARDPTKAFYLPWSRAWELALGAMVAEREMFPGGQTRPPFVCRLLERSPALFSLEGADLAFLFGVALMISAVFLLDDAQPFPGWRALIPTLGCALALANPKSRWAERLLDGRAAQWLGGISYPLYLWHWPLLSFAFIEWGPSASPVIRVALAGVAILLAWLTARFIERPTSASFRRQALGVVATLTLAMIGCGAVGALTKSANGFASRYPPGIAALFDFPPRGLADALYRAGQCFYDRRDSQNSLATLRDRLIGQFAEAGCATPRDAGKPTILILGDSHGAHLYPGIAAEFGAVANVLQLNANYCAPLIEPAQTGEGPIGTERCRIVNRVIQEMTRKIRPAVVVIGAFYWQYLTFPAYRYPDFETAYRASLAELSVAGVGPILVVGDPPIWRPALPSLVARELLTSGASPRFSSAGLVEESLAIDEAQRRQPWPPGVAYVSLIAALCDANGCPRRVGDDLPNDLFAIDYGHLSRQGSIFVARNVLGPAIRAALAAAKAR